MRILQVSSAREHGGGETHVLELVAALRKRGHDVVLAGRRDGPLHPDAILSPLRLRSMLKRERFDVVHAHVARDYPVVAAAAMGIRGLAVIFTRHLLYPVRRNPLYRRVDGWIATTTAISKTLEPLKPKASVVIPNWIDLEKFSYRPHEFHKPVALGLIGQIAPHKGHDDAMAAVRELGSEFRLVIAGKGEPAYEAKLKKKAAGLNVEFAGFVQLPEFFEQIDIVIVPSWDEPFGLISLEAMATGIPLVGTGPADVVRGVLVPPRDPKALVKAILNAKPDPTARKHIEQNFDLRDVIPHVEGFYKKVRASRG